MSTKSDTSSEDDQIKPPTAIAGSGYFGGNLGASNPSDYQPDKFLYATSRRSKCTRLCASVIGTTAVLLVAACGDTNPNTTPTTVTATAETTAHSTEAAPAPGEWTLENIDVGAKVPKEDLERIFPKWDVPEPPATLTEFSEQGAKDAAQYYSRLTEIAFYFKDGSLFDQIDGGRCSNCATLRANAEETSEPGGYVQESNAAVVSIKRHPDLENVYEVQMDLTYPISVRLDEQNEAIASVDANDKQTVFHYVTFADGSWTPIYVMLDRSHV